MALTRATVRFCTLMAIGLLTVACGAEDSPRSDSPVRINELQGKNSATINDPADGNSDDWIELYNPSAEEVDLEGYFLSDDSEKLTKFTFGTDITIPAGGFLLLWADGSDDVNQGPLHTGFKLGGEGDRVFLADAEGYLVDEIEFGAPAGEDYSYARAPDGTGAFVWCATPTPEAANGASCGG